MAIECIDDQIAVLGERLVEVALLWNDILEVIAGEHTEALVLVFPTWWSSARVVLVAEAAHSIAAEVVVLQRASVLGADSDATVIELSEEFVVMAPPGSEVTVLARGEHDVAAALDAAGSTSRAALPAATDRPDSSRIARAVLKIPTRHAWTYTSALSGVMLSSGHHDRLKAVPKAMSCCIVQNITLPFC